MTMTCPIVQVIRGDTVVDINESDFVEGVDKLYEKPAQKVEPTKTAKKSKAK